MTASLPIPGGDENAWALKLNDFLEVAHNADGTLKPLLESSGSDSIVLMPGTSGTVKVLAPDEASTMLQFEDIAAASGEFAAAIVFSGSGSDATSKRVWGIGVDVSASIRYRDFVMGFKTLADGTVSDLEGFYGSYNGGTVSTPSSWGIGYSQPPATFRVRILPGSGDLTQGNLALHTNVGQTGHPFVIFGNGSGETSPMVSVDSDFGLMVRSNATNRTVTDGVTNSTTTVTSATAAFTPYDRGRTIVGTGIPTGAYIVSVASATSVTISAAATASATGVSLTIYKPFFSVNSGSMKPFFQVTPGAGNGAVTSQGDLNGFGPGVSPVPTATLDIAQTGTNDATFNIRTPSNGSLQITAKGATAEVDVWTANASALKLGTNATAVLTLSPSGGMGFFGGSAVAKPTVSGSKGANAALTSLMTALSSMGLVVDSTT